MTTSTPAPTPAETALQLQRRTEDELLLTATAAQRAIIARSRAQRFQLWAILEKNLMRDMYGTDLRLTDSFGTPTGGAMKTEIVFTDERLEDLRVVWNGSATFNVWVGDFNSDVFTHYGDDQGGRCTLEQAQQAAGEWFEEQVTGHD